METHQLRLKEREQAVETFQVRLAEREEAFVAFQAQLREREEALAAFQLRVAEREEALVAYQAKELRWAALEESYLASRAVLPPTCEKMAVKKCGKWIFSLAAKMEIYERLVRGLLTLSNIVRMLHCSRLDDDKPWTI